MIDQVMSQLLAAVFGAFGATVALMCYTNDDMTKRSFVYAMITASIFIAPGLFHLLHTAYFG